MAAATEKSGIGRINFSEKSRPILPWYGFPDPLFPNSFSSWRRFINFLLVQFCHKAFMNDFILAVAAVSHWKIRMKLSLGVPEKVGRFLLWPFLTFFGENLAVKWRQLSNKEIFACFLISDILWPPSETLCQLRLGFYSDNCNNWFWQFCASN